jgi:hypothetical protein
MLKGLIAGLAGGMVASWAVNRFYDLARESSRSESIVPYIAGAALGAAYATVVHRRDVPLVARVPLGAAIWLGEPERTAAPPKGGRDLKEKARNVALRTASRSLKKAAERALFA